MIPFCVLIPSYRRPTECVTAKQFSPELQERTQLVIHPDECPGYRASNPNLLLILTDRQGGGTSAIRQHMVDRLFGEAECLVMLDDDLKLVYSAGFVHGKKSFTSATPAQIDSELSWAARYAVANSCILRLGTPFFNTTQDRMTFGKRGCGSFIIPRACRSAGKFSGIATMEDIKFYLEACASGVRVGQLNHLCVVQARVPKGSGEGAIPGRAERHEAAARQLARDWPPFIRLRDASKNKAHMANIGSPVDITFYASKACPK